MKEAFNNAIIHDDMHAESITLHADQGSRNYLMLSQSEAHNSVTPLTDTVPE